MSGTIDISGALTTQFEAMHSPRWVVAQAHGEDDHAASDAHHDADHDEHAADHTGDDHHGDEHHDDAHHGEEHPAEFKMPDELPNFYTIIASLQDDGHHGDHEGGHHGPWYLNSLFTIFYCIVFCTVIISILRRRSVDKPSRAQVALEGIFSGLLNFFGEVVGPENARKYVPFVGSLWLFILMHNWFGLIPFFKSPTAYFETTVALGIATFCYVNYQGIRAGGLGHYLWHLCGAPVGVVGWALAPLMFVLETIGTFIKPISLSLRLYGNIFGEDKLLASFLGLGLMLVAGLTGDPQPWIGVPLHLPFMFLALLTSVIQATVFAMLAAVYIALLLPHHDHEHDEEHEHHEAGHHSEKKGLEPAAA